MDPTFQYFAEFLRSNADKIRQDLLIEDTGLRRTLQPAFQQFFKPWRKSGTEFSRIAATDSSEFVRELYNGKKIILTRAYTVQNDYLETEFFSDVVWAARDDLRPFISLLMEDCEHKSAIRAIKKWEPEVCFIDGSLTGRLMHNLRKLDVENHASLSSKYKENLKELLDTAARSKTVIVFLSKSSESRTLMRKIIEILKMDKQSLQYVDQVLIRSMAEFPGFSVPIRFDLPLPYAKDALTVWSSHIVPVLHDLPLKIDFITQGAVYDDSVFKQILDTIFWGYTGVKVHNLWISRVDSMVKFRTEIMERIYMRHFEKTVGVDFPETRGERRARIRI